MFDKKSFLIELIRNDMTMKSLANAMCINPMTLSRKVKGETDFYRWEIQKISEVLNLDEDAIDKIFFGMKVR
jgi:hypothetical protein